MQVPNFEKGLRDILTEILEAIFIGAKEESLKDHPLALLIRNEFKEHLHSIAANVDPNFQVETSVGIGHWATIVWGAVLAPAVTDRTSKGYVVVYHFDPSGEKVFLSICQGAGAVIEEFGRKDGLAVLRDRAALGRKRLADLLPLKAINRMSFTSSKELPVRYEAGFITGFEYLLEEVPSEHELQSDLEELCRLYRILSFRGGVHDSLEDLAMPEQEEVEISLCEKRRYSFHRRIDRNQALVRLVKERKGDTCECCGMAFKDVYGSLGENFIEAHHLTPISELAEDAAVSYNPVKDFAVLCSNCHRMIHRMDDPSDVEGLQEMVKRMKRAKKK